MDPFQTITLVVKAPNQKIDDQTVECAAGWTVRKLKNHLAEVYPSKPHEKDQKLIYSGQLLSDHLTLKDILRQYEGSSAHTVHLVCASNMNNHGTSPRSSNNGNTNGNIRHNNSVNQPTNGSDSTLRQRNTANAQSNVSYQQQQQQQMPPQAFNPYGNYNYMMQFQQQQQQQQQPANMPNYMTPYQQQQAMWMQQMYMQQMAQYMQYMSQSGMPPMPENPIEETETNQNVVPPQVANENRVNNQPANQNVRMNAGVGGPPMDDDEDDINRDWLDWVYVLCRFSLLLSIVYFYSSIDRFLLVMGFVAIMYLYQGGWFRVRRRQVRRVNRVEPQQPVNQPEQPAAVPQPPPQEVPEQPVQEPPQEQNENINNEESTNTDQTTDSENTGSDIVEEEVQPGAMETAWNFVSSFFTSLIPQGPEFPN
ncbi:homocysteine-responsive endoplasmic reticulum-resident ubiquitin-like domain member 2 protein [Glandiceps talaboti]